MRNKQQLSYSDYEKRIAELCENRKIKVSIIGKSIMDRNVHKLEIGAGEKKIVLLGGVCGESEVCETLLSFAEEFIKAQEEGKRPCGTNPAYVSRYRGLVIYPLINPDALEYRCFGVNDDNPIKNRLISMNAESQDFSDWSANGRGVSLERNSPIDFEKRRSCENARGIFNGAPSGFSGNTPESEPELCCLLSDISGYENVRALIQISKGKNGVHTPCRHQRDERSERVMKCILSSCRAQSKALSPDDCGITDLVYKRYGIYSYKVSLEKCELKYLRGLLYSVPVTV